MNLLDIWSVEHHLKIGTVISQNPTVVSDTQFTVKKKWQSFILEKLEP